MASDAVAWVQAPVTSDATVALWLPTLVNVSVVVRAVPPGTWSRVPMRALIVQVVFVLVAVTEPPVPEPVE